ncbi:uncharacterized protein Z520_01612 [Fonsecaea multimorphosa CBS 102226]|uniref:Transcription factor domain-containing protein n=1 Tax=Fonsecaea multimorphosa CBS 102226 TaxID=1442371 RepID=A0A0D2KI32_9EURO|nr:uncharacterized protein Z520_01612 [Fonsecaea multimorphosa CBS 102226]KIY03145.1 hypothetical protein Z520_01612 [Fonsecaea multimorphosa CBS 102226]OAL30390.1 hypothetical protein AYO22_01588 [Fonsecaea multimorphosa]
MAGGDPPFVNLSQKEYGEQKWRGRQLSVVQSHIASWRHVRRRQQTLTDPTAAPPEIAAALRPHGKIVRRPQCPSAEVPHTRRQPQGTALHDSSTQDDSVLENTEQEDLSFEDLNKIFQLDENVGERECASTICNAAPNERLPVWTERSDDIDQRLPTRPSPQNSPHRSSTVTTCATRPSRRQIWVSQAAILQGADNDHGARPTHEQARGAHDIFPAISEITSSLDPFVRLPVQLPESDKSLLHFYFNYGRCWLWGTSQTPRYCAALYTLQTLIEDPIYVLVAIVLGEGILDRLTLRSPRPRYYHRRAQIYKKANTLLSDETASFPQKALTIMYLAILEYVSARHDLQEMHIQALDDFVESNGGVAIFRTRSESHEIFLCSARSYVTQFVRAEVCLPTRSRLQSTVSRYLYNLSQVHRWESNFKARLSAEDVPLLHHRLRLQPLIDYLEHLGQIRTSVERTRVWDAASGGHFCVYSLVITLVEFTHSPDTVFEFLEQVQECMIASIDKSLQNESDLNGLHPFATGQMIGYVRTLMFRDVGNVKEIRICQAQADAQKVFALLSQSRRDELVSYFVGSVLGLARTSRAIGPNGIAATAASRQTWRAETLKAWTAQQRTRQE